MSRIAKLGARSEPAAAVEETKQRLSVQLSWDVVERLRDAVYWTPGITMTGLVETCIIDALRRMESERGTPFPKRSRELSPGRPMK